MTQIPIYRISRSLIPSPNHYCCALCLNNWPTQWCEQFISPWRTCESVCGTDCFSGIECCRCVLALTACFHAKYRTALRPECTVASIGHSHAGLWRTVSRACLSYWLRIWRNLSIVLSIILFIILFKVLSLLNLYRSTYFYISIIFPSFVLSFYPPFILSIFLSIYHPVHFYILSIILPLFHPSFYSPLSFFHPLFTSLLYPLFYHSIHLSIHFCRSILLSSFVSFHFLFKLFYPSFNPYFPVSFFL